LSDSASLPALLDAAAAWGVLQRANALASSGAGEVTELPEHCERILRFNAATFGASWFAGLVDGFSVSGLAKARAIKDQGGSPGDMALASAGIEGKVEVLAYELNGGSMYAPGYLVAVDHETCQVIVALRGTSSVKDAITDLICQPAPVQIGGHSGFAHDGMLRAATRLSEPLAALASRGLEKLKCDSPRVLITGHSMGAGVASLVAAVWRDANRFPSANVRCIAFAAPQVLDAELALAQGNHIISLVNADDLVPRFSLATSMDLRQAMLALADPLKAGLPSDLTPGSIRSADAKGDASTLGQWYTMVKSKAGSSTGRMFPPGQIVILRSGQSARRVGHDQVDELHISEDMASAHMPRAYLLAIQETLRLRSS